MATNEHSTDLFIRGNPRVNLTSYDATAITCLFWDWNDTGDPLVMEIVDIDRLIAMLKEHKAWLRNQGCQDTYELPAPRPEKPQRWVYKSSDRNGWLEKK